MYRRPELEVRWPNLASTNYQVTSPKSQEYNCFAWAAEDVERWWQPIPGEEFYWPDGVPNEETLDAYIKASVLARLPLLPIDCNRLVRACCVWRHFYIVDGAWQQFDFHFQ
jgi:hypothetical protein